MHSRRLCDRSLGLSSPLSVDAEPPGAADEWKGCLEDCPRWPRGEWRARAAAHRARVEPLAEAALQRRARGGKHPVEDFLFTYYRFPPGRLKQWLPPLGVAIELEPAGLAEYAHLDDSPWLCVEAGWAALDPARLTDKTREAAAWIAMLCRRILQRPPHYRCYGLHEWAMVYRQTPEQIRHQGHALRLPPEELARFVESQSLCCTHYDAYRFFTAEAAPRNAFRPTLEARPEFEQGACLHANMDLYKWAAKLWPWVGSDLVGRAFALAAEGRVLDMRASPYDLAHLGYAPIRIETVRGRAEYESAQRALAEKARPLREELAQAAARLARWQCDAPEAVAD